MRDLVLEDDSILKKPGNPFDFVNPQEDPRKLAEELVKAMYKYDGLGLSACQIGVDLRVFAMSSPDHHGHGCKDDTPIICFNPKIHEYSKETTYVTEGCLSFPGLFFPLERAWGVNVTFATFDGEMRKAQFTQLSAKVFQHEFDHMLGRLYIDHVSSYKLKNARKKQALWKRKKRKK